MALVIALLTLVVAGSATAAYVLASGPDTLEGDGYSYEMPDGWSKLIGTEGSYGFDTVTGVGESMLDGTEGIAVGISESPAATDPASLRDMAIASMSGLPDVSNIGSVPDTTIDGASAVGVRASYVGESGDPYVITAYAIVHADRLYAISYSSQGDLDDHDLATLDAILDDWEWR